MTGIATAFLDNINVLRAFRARLHNNLADQLDGPIVDRLDECILALGRKDQKAPELQAQRQELITAISERLDRTLFKSALEVLLTWFNDLTLLKNGLELADSLAIKAGPLRKKNYQIVLNNLSDFFQGFGGNARKTIEELWERVSHHKNFYQDFLGKQLPERISQVLDLQKP